MKNMTFGVLKDDVEEVSFYLKSGTNLSYKSYNDIASLYKALDNDEVNMVVVPNIMYLDYTIENNKYSINYYLTEIKKPNHEGLELSAGSGRINLLATGSKALCNLSQLCLLFSIKLGNFFSCSHPMAACISVTLRL